MNVANCCKFDFHDYVDRHIDESINALRHQMDTIDSMGISLICQGLQFFGR